MYLVYFVTDRCNARCRHCLFGDGTVFPEVSRELTLEELDKLTRRMGKLLFLLPTGGEPFLRKDLAEIVEIFYRNTGVRNVGIPTNGSLTERVVETVRKILTACPDIDLGIDVSLDAVGKAHDEIRGVPGLFDKAVETYRSLKRIEVEDPRLNVNIETTVSSFNDAILDENYDYFVHTLRPTALFTLLTRGKPSDPQSLRFNIDRYLRYAERLERGLLSGELSGYRHFPFADLVNAKRIIRHRLITRVVKRKRCLVPCYAGSLGAALFANGDVYPCELRTDLKLGNVRDSGYDFMGIWRGARAHEARRAIRKGRCFCTYECFLTLNILFNPRFLPGLLWHWARIKIHRLKNRMTRGAAHVQGQ
ncbi:MAG: radical SAM protein [Candidatus Aureabacteria bacterium]|nr:radical SAM protein [Candidatus Auribacterota bacterium]